ncbi:MAG: DUF1003 domain-containing protein [bacterium]
MAHQTLSVQELKQIHKPVIKLKEREKTDIKTLDKIAIFITQRVGTMGFFGLIFLWTISWLSWNTLGPKDLRFDPFPGFVLWLFISNMIQIFLMPLIMIGQNLQGRYSDIRAENDFEINVKAEVEIETVLKHLENQNEIILKILEKVEEEK